MKRYKREEKITYNTAIGTTGGLLGLFLGFSFISLAEIVYLICRGRGSVGAVGGAALMRKSAWHPPSRPITEPEM